MPCCLCGLEVNNGGAASQWVVGGGWCELIHLRVGVCVASLARFGEAAAVAWKRPPTTVVGSQPIDDRPILDRSIDMPIDGCQRATKYAQHVDRHLCAPHQSIIAYPPARPSSSRKSARKQPTHGNGRVIFKIIIWLAGSSSPSMWRPNWSAKNNRTGSNTCLDS